MIPQAYITEWSHKTPWPTNEQVEQDLAICRALVEIFSNDWLSSSLAFRGGTALNKLFLPMQARYSEDIDLVQIRTEPIKETVQQLQKVLAFLGDAVVKPRKDGIQLIFRFESELPPVQRMRLKVETNTREHFSVLEYVSFPFSLHSSWFEGSSSLTTYCLEELLGTKLRALYQRRKGRDLYDLYASLTHRPDMDIDTLLRCYHEYMRFSVQVPPSRKQFLQNMDAKMQDAEFLGDTAALLLPGQEYDPVRAYKVVREKIIERI